MKTPKKKSAKPFRQNVCAVIVDDDRKHVLVFKRIDQMFKRPWQFPQGGVDAGESPRQTLLRELEEEIGTCNVEIVGRVAQPIRYVYPPDVVRRLVADGSKLARFRGQEQHWFLVRLRGGAQEIHFRHEPAEFMDYRWVTPRQAIGLVVAFKREAYRKGLTGLGLLRHTSVAKKQVVGRKPQKSRLAPNSAKRHA